MRNKKRYILAVCATVFVLLIIALIAIGKSQEQEESPTNNEQTENENVQQGNSAPENNETKSEYTVIFLNDDESILKQVTVEKGGAPHFPGIPSMMQGYAFDGWSEDLSSITRDTVVFPVREKISDGKNIILLSDAYGKTEDVVTMPLMLCGEVEICCFEATVEYDTSVLRFAGFENEDPCMTVSCNEETGTVHLNYISTQNTTGQVDLCDLLFEVIGTKKTQSGVNITIAHAAIAVGDEEYEAAECDVRNADVMVIGR